MNPQDFLKLPVLPLPTHETKSYFSMSLEHPLNLKIWYHTVNLNQSIGNYQFCDPVFLEPLQETFARKYRFYRIQWNCLNSDALKAS